MKKLQTSIVLILFLYILNCPAFSQEHPNSIYLEVLGNGGIYSINYDRMFLENLSCRVGFMYFFSDIIIYEVSDLSLTFMLNFILGSGNHKLELGVGPAINYEDTGIVGSDPESKERITGTATIAYRYQRTEGGVFIKIAFTPLFEGGEIKPWGGISFGSSF